MPVKKVGRMSGRIPVGKPWANVYGTQKRRAESSRWVDSVAAKPVDIYDIPAEKFIALLEEWEAGLRE